MIDFQSLTTFFCRDTRIRTWDPLLPKQVRYRTALHPEDGYWLIGYQLLVGTNNQSTNNQSRGGTGIRTRGTLYNVRRFSKPVVSATHPFLRKWAQK